MKYKLYIFLLATSILISNFTFANVSKNDIAKENLDNQNAVFANFNSNFATTCIGSNVTFTDASFSTTSPLTTWFWTFGPGASVASFTGQVPPTISYSTAGAKSVTLTVFDANGASNSITHNVLILASNFADLGIDTAICAGQSVEVGHAQLSNVSYFWKDNNNNLLGSASSLLVSPTTNTTYIVIAATASGCVDTDTLTVTVNPLPVANIGATDSMSICPGTTVALGAPTVAGLTYSWLPTTGIIGSNTVANPSAVVTANTTYTLTVTNAFNCSASKAVKVQLFAPVVAHAGLDQLICFGNGINLGGTPVVASGGSGNYNFSWTPSSTLSPNANIANPIANPNDTTEYILTVTDQNPLCGSDKDSVIVNVLPLPNIIINTKSIYCLNDAPAVLTATPAGGRFYGIGVDSTTNTFDPANSNIVIGVPTLITYRDTINGCFYEASVSVVVMANPVVDAGLNTTICTNQGQTSAQLNATGAVNYVWTPNMNINDDSIGFPIVSPTATTTYFVTGDVFGCKATDSIIITVSNACGVLPDTAVIANPDNDATSVNVPVSVHVINNDKTFLDNYTPTVTVTTPAQHGTTSVTNGVVNYTPAHNYIGYDTFIYTMCDSTVGNPAIKCDTAIVIIAIAPNANNEFSNVICNDTSWINISLNDSIGGGNYVPTYTIIDNPNHGTATITNTTLEYIPVNAYNGPDTIQYMVCVNGLCDNAYLFLNVSCAPPAQPVDAVNDSIGFGTGSNAALSCGASTIDELANDTFNTTGAVKSVKILNNPNHGSVSVTSTNTIKYTPVSNYTGTDNFKYILTVDGVSDTATVFVNVACKAVKPCEANNAISPDGDGINDAFTIPCAPSFPNNKLLIFNRWGNEVYNTNNYQNDWKGVYKGLDVPDGTYFYYFEFNDNNGTKPISGFITIKR